MRTILRIRRILAAVSVLLVLATGATACSTSSGSATRAGGPLRIVAAENFWGSIAGQLAGSRAVVTSIITNPNVDPHDYEPTPGDARDFATADLVIVNGIGYDGWAQRLLAANPESSRIVLDVGKTLGFEAGANPHQWYSDASVAKFIDATTADLESLDPAGQSFYAHHERDYQTTSLAQYEALITEMRRDYSGTPIGGSESIVSPLADTLGLQVLTPEGFLRAVSEGTEPSAADKAAADTQITGNQISVFVLNTQNVTPDVERLASEARQARIPVVDVTETLTPAGATFQDWQVRQLRALLAALHEAASGAVG